jgi:HlyD family secretion protein
LIVRRVIVAMLCVLLPGLPVGLFLWKRLASASPAGAAARTFTVRRGDIAVRVTETGTVEPRSKVEVKSKVGGKVVRLEVEEGARVRVGQVLAVLDPIEQQSQVGQIRAQVTAAQARLRQAISQAQTERQTAELAIRDARSQLQSAQVRLEQARRQAQVQPRLTRMAVAQAAASDRAARESLQRLNRSALPQELADTQGGLDQAQAEYDLAEKGLARQKALVAKGFVPQSSVDEAERTVATARARLRTTQARADTVRDRVDADRREAEARVEQSAAALDAARANEVQDVLRQDDVAAARAAVATARLALQRAQALKAQVEVREAEVDAAQASVTQIRSSLAEVETRLQDTVLRAPMAGVVTRRYVEVGELVTSGTQTFSSGTPLMQIADLSRMQVKVQVNEVDVARLKVGQQARIELDASRGSHLPGRVTAVAPASAVAASGGSQSGGGGGGGGQSGGIVKFEVKIDIMGSDARLRPGMSANVDIITAERKGVLVVPLEAVDLGASRVKRNLDGRPVDAPVTLGLRSDSLVEIRAGLKENDRLFPARYKGPPRRKLEMGPRNER